MDRKKVAIAFMIVTSVGTVLSTVGMMTMPRGELYTMLYPPLLFLFVLTFFIAVLVFYPGLFKAEQNQSQVETDSSLF